MNTDFLKSKGPSEISRVLGISRPTATNYTKGRSCISVDQALYLARHYSVPLSAIVDPNYREANQDDLITALDAENRMLRTKLSAIQNLIKSTCNNVESIAGDLETETIV